MNKEKHIEIKEQNKLSAIFNAQYLKNSIPQSMLFVGQAGSGKLSAAKELSIALVGEKYRNNVYNDNMPDVIILEPEGAAGFLSEQIKPIITDEKKAPILSNNKVYILKDVDKLGVSSANAFLKTLEEPASFTYFILISNNKDNVLPTIVSRCQIYSFNSIPLDKSVDIVVKKTKCSCNEAKYAINLFAGQTDKAISYLENNDIQDLHDELIYFINNINTFNDWEVLQKAGDIDKKTEELTELYKDELQEDFNDLEDVLDSIALKNFSAANKRKVLAYKKELARLVCSIIEQELKENITNKIEFIEALNLVSEYRKYLNYNIKMELYYEVLLSNLAAKLKQK